MGKTLKADVVAKWINKFTKDGKLTIPKQELAKRMMHGESGMFATLETARAAIRYYTGSTGGKAREAIKSSGVGRVEISSIAEALQLAGIHEKHVSAVPVALPSGKWLVMNDIHIPFHHEQALAAAIKHGLDSGIEHILLNGDIIDCYDISRFSKELGRPKISEEIQMGRAFLSYLRALVPNGHIWYKLGNHEERMRHYILRNARELGDFQELELSHLLNFEGLNIKQVGREVITVGKLAILHGHETGESVFSPVNAARGMFIKAKASVMFGHNHQRSTHSEANIFGESIVVHSLGALCKLDPEYRPFGYLRWVHGAAILNVQESLEYQIENFQVINGEIYH